MKIKAKWKYNNNNNINSIDKWTTDLDEIHS